MTKSEKHISIIINYLKFSTWYGAVILILAIQVMSCGQSENTDTTAPALTNSDLLQRNTVKSQLDVIRDRGKLIVLTTNLPTTYYYDRDDTLAGPEYEMTQSFAESIGVEAEYKVYDSTKSVLEALRNGEGDIAASGLTINNKRKKEFDFGPVYQTTEEYLVCHRSKKQIKGRDDLKNIEVVIAADTNYLETIKAYPEMTWVVDDTSNTSGLIEKVADKKIECTISDSILYNLERRFYTEIQKKYTFEKSSELAWMLNKNSDSLLQAITEWFEKYQEDYDLAYMLEKYYGHIDVFDYVDVHRFLSRASTRLPKYKIFFIKAANKNNIEPTLLVAQSYQESHWDPKAKSPTGVRGIMMLTQPVAKSLGVSNRLDAEQNINAGAKFLKKMKKMLTDIDEPDKSWLALAAYNIGRGHFRDAQSLAEKLNRNPDRWSEMKEILPLLSQKKYYKDLHYGYARGKEPVRYVTQIRSYEELLKKHLGNSEFDHVK